MANRSLATVATLLLFQSPASAQSIELCRLEADSLKRLQCYDALPIGDVAAKPEAPPDVATVPALPQWTIKESQSPIDDSAQITASLFDPDSSVILAVRCQEKKTEVVFVTSEYLGTESVPVVLRTGTDKPNSERWSASVNGKAAFSPQPINFIRALPNDTKLFARILGYGGRQVDAQFNTGTFSVVRDKVAATCKWPPAKPKP